MKCIFGVFLSFLLLFPSVSFSGDANPFAKELFKIPDKYKKDFGNYRTRFARLSGFEFSGLHWNDFVVVYAGLDKGVYKKNYFEYLKFINMDEEDEEDEEVKINFRPYPVGAIIVKENYTSKGSLPSEPESLTIMKKMPPGYDTENGDWFYLQTDKDGNLLIEGKHGDPVVTEVCSKCHSNIKDRDFIFSTFLTVN